MYAKDIPSRLQSYARRRKMSACRGLSTSNCYSNPKTCSYASGTIRQFCRRKNNTPHTLSRRRRRRQRSRSRSIKTLKKRTHFRRSKRLQSKVPLRRSLRIQQRLSM